MINLMSTDSANIVTQNKLFNNKIRTSQYALYDQVYFFRVNYLKVIIIITLLLPR